MANIIIAIGGEPASGKTTLMKRILKEFLPLKKFKFGLVRGLYCEKRKLYFIGIYDGSVFSGTDKLSMAVQPVFLTLLDKIKNGVFVFEGDRLFNQSLFDKKQCKIFVIEANKQILKLRHEQRADNQTEKFKKAKKTKIKNIKQNNEVTILLNNTKEESENCFTTIIQNIKSGL
jgi:dephospho-CoA kinase